MAEPTLTSIDWSYYSDMSRLEQLALMDEDERDAIIEGLSEEDLLDPEMTLRPSQLEVVNSDSWVTMFSAGRGTGKTLCGSHWVIKRARENPGCTIALLGRTVADVRDVMIGGDAGILASSPADFYPTYTPSLRKLTWPNGSTAYTYSSDTPSQLRGPQQHYAWCLLAGTPVRTPTGDRPIEQLQVGDLVSTLVGPRAVTATSQREAELWSLSLVDGRTLYGSAEHPIATSRGWVPLSEVRSSDRPLSVRESMPAYTLRKDQRRSCEFAEHAEQSSPGRSGGVHPASAQVVDPRWSRIARRWSVSASHVDSRFSHRGTDHPGLRSIAVAGAATQVGLRGSVHNLTVEGEHHFFADGVLTHNCDELAAFRMAPDDSGATSWDNALLSTRLGEHPQLLVTTTPKRVNLVRELVRQSRDPLSGVSLHTASTLSNRANLSAEYMRAIHDKYADTHLERQELYGELIGDSPGALWREKDIVIQSVPSGTDLIHIIGVDPSVTRHGDDTGIVVIAGTTEADPMERRAWVLEDLTFQGGPDEWAPIIIDAQKRYSPPGDDPAIVVVEGNQGGELLNMVLHQLSPGLPIARVQAIRSKAARAEPVVMAYRQKRVFHTEEFIELTDELTGWEPDISRWSPGHLDALVWACHTMLVDSKPLWPFAPVLVGGSYDDLSLGSAVVPAFRRHRKAPGMAIAPWRAKPTGTDLTTWGR